MTFGRREEGDGRILQLLGFGPRGREKGVCVLLVGRWSGRRWGVGFQHLFGGRGASRGWFPVHLGDGFQCQEVLSVCYRHDDAPMADNNGNNRGDVERKENKKIELDGSFGSPVELLVYWSELWFDHFLI